MKVIRKQLLIYLIIKTSFQIMLHNKMSKLKRWPIFWNLLTVDKLLSRHFQIWRKQFNMKPMEIKIYQKRTLQRLCPTIQSKRPTGTHQSQKERWSCLRSSVPNSQLIMSRKIKISKKKKQFWNNQVLHYQDTSHKFKILT